MILVHPSIGQIELQEFSSSSQNQTYLAVYGERRFELNHNLYSLIRTLQSVKSFEDAAPIYSFERNRTYSSGEIKQLFTRFVLPILETEQSKNTGGFYYTKELLSTERVALITKKLKFLFQPKLFALLLIVSIGLDVFAISISKVVSVSGFNIFDLFAVGLLFFVSVIFHELGHASASNFFGVQHGHIGVGLYLNIPVFYADVSNAWKLPRQQRLIIDLAGIYFQLLFLIPIVILHLYYPHPVFQFLIISINLSFLFDLNPFFKFDGYWIFSDLIGIANLGKKTQDMAVSFVRWLLGKPTESSFFKSLSIRYKTIMIFYLVLINVFFGYYIFYRVPLFLFSLTAGLPRNVRTIFIEGHFNLSLCLNFAMQIFIAALSIYFLWRMIKSLFKQAIRIYE